MDQITELLKSGVTLITLQLLRNNIYQAAVDDGRFGGLSWADNPEAAVNGAYLMLCHEREQRGSAKGPRVSASKPQARKRPPTALEPLHKPIHPVWRPQLREQSI